MRRCTGSPSTRQTRDEFWRKQSSQFIDWIRPYDRVSTGGFAVGDHAWFVGGQLNVSACCLDRHLATKADKTAILWEADEPGQSKSCPTSKSSTARVGVANALKLHGCRKGDFVTIYMPMMPDTAMAMLACTRIGCPHSVVFAGFTATSLKDRIVDSQSKWVCTADVGKRGSKTIKLKEITDAAVNDCPNVQRVSSSSSARASTASRTTRATCTWISWCRKCDLIVMRRPWAARRRCSLCIPREYGKAQGRGS